MTLNSRKKILDIFIYSILPVILILIGINFKKAIPSYSISCVDPEMAYLYNGLAVLHGHLPNFIDHPGIPLQYISAVVIGILHMFRGGNIDEDVIKNPDAYIHAITYSFIFINAIILFLTGILTRKVLKNYFSGFFIQLTPFLSVMYLNMASRILPEFFSLTVSLLFFIITLYYLTSNRGSDGKAKKGFAIWYSLTFAYAVSVKITFLHFLIIPLFVLGTKKEKLNFIKYSVPALAIFMLPAIVRLKYFIWWFSKLFLYSGQYGQGEASVVDSNLLRNNLLEIYHTNPLLIYGCFILIAGLILLIIPKLNFRHRNDPWFRAFVSFTFVTCITVIVIAKQLKFYYLSPAFVMAIPSLFFLLAIVERKQFFRNRLFPFFFVIIFILLYFENKPAFAHIEPLSKDRAITQKDIGGKYDNKPIAIAANYYGAPFYGYSSFYGFAYSSNSRRDEIRPILNKIMPDLYIYNRWNNLFNTWNNEGSFYFNDLLSKYDSLYLYTGDNAEAVAFEKESLGMNIRVENDIREIYHNPATSESLSLYTPNKANSNNWVVTCDFETKTDDYFACSNHQHTSGLQSDEVALSGQYSCRFDKEHQFGIDALLTDVKKGEVYTVTVWKLNNNTNACLVISGVKPNIYYSAISKSTEEKNGWIKLSLQLIVDEKLCNEDFRIYCWQTNDAEPSYWDNWELTKSNNL